MPRIPIKLSKENNDLLVKTNQEVKATLDAIGTPTTGSSDKKPIPGNYRATSGRMA